MASTRRMADVRLRGTSGWLRPRMYWPARSNGPPALLVAFGLPGMVCAQADVVVLASDLVCPDDAIALLGWAADHAADLDAEPGPLLVAGAGPGAVLARGAAQHARDAGWPPIRAELHYRDGHEAAELLPLDVRRAISSGRTDEIRRGLTS